MFNIQIAPYGHINMRNVSGAWYIYNHNKLGTNDFGILIAMAS